MTQQEKLISNFAQTMGEMDPEWIEESRKIHPMFWWKLNRLMNLSENIQSE